MACTHKEEFNQLLGSQLFWEQNQTKIYSGGHVALQQTKPSKGVGVILKWYEGRLNNIEQLFKTKNKSTSMKIEQGWPAQ